jgi:hypothetical protein
MAVECQRVPEASEALEASPSPVVLEAQEVQEASLRVVELVELVACQNFPKDSSSQVVLPVVLLVELVELVACQSFPKDSSSQAVLPVVLLAELVDSPNLVDSEAQEAQEASQSLVERQSHRPQGDSQSRVDSQRALRLLVEWLIWPVCKLGRMNTLFSLSIFNRLDF